MVRRDVPQTAVEFYDHRIVDPSTAAAETRNVLKNRALNALVTQVLERLLQLRALKGELKEQQRILSIKLKILQTRPDGLGVLTSEQAPGESGCPGRAPGVGRYRPADPGLGRRVGLPEEYLRQLTAALQAPQQVLTVTPVVMQLNWMGVKQGKAPDGGSRDIRLAEIEFQDRLKRVAVFVDIARRDCLKP
ncbi:MAG: hypothetical protein MZU91_13640 [Desulfosudis oleivorans]|nr:hypothetical protein [Desulfosudis oleivorans]